MLVHPDQQFGGQRVEIADPGNLSGQWMVSKDGGVQPRWSRNGKELLYISRDSKLMSVTVSTTPAFQARTPEALFTTPLIGGGITTTAYRWDMTPDGKRFLMVTAPTGTSSTPITVVMNWAAGLRK